MTSVAIVHDYLTQRGGAERVVLSMAAALTDAPVHTALFDPQRTFPQFSEIDVRPLPINAVAPLRHNHRLGFPVLARAFSNLVVDADVVVCSSSGWAHGARTTGRKVVYCHTPPRWLYQSERYVRSDSARFLLRPAFQRLRAWDARAASDPATVAYVANSTIVRDRIRETYGMDARVLHPPVTVDTSGAGRPVSGIDAGFFLCVSRLLPYKNVDAVVAAFAALPHERLVVVGDGPARDSLTQSAPPNVTFLGTVEDVELRWLYRNGRGLIGAAYEDFGLTPLEALAFGMPAAVLRFGGYLDTVIEDETGVFFDEPAPAMIASAVGRLIATRWDPVRMYDQAARFSEEAFHRALLHLVSEAATDIAHPCQLRP